MKTALTALAVFSLVIVATASADHKQNVRPAQPAQLAHALHVQAHNLEQEVELHYPHSPGMKQISYIITRLAETTQQHVESGNPNAARSSLRYMQRMLGQVDASLRPGIGRHGRADGRHVRASIAEMEAVAESLDQSLRQTVFIIPGRGHAHDHFEQYRQNQFGRRHFVGFAGRDNHAHVGRIAHDDHVGHGGHDDHAHGAYGGHDDHDHGDRHARDDRDAHDHDGHGHGAGGGDGIFDVRPGMIHINKGNFRIGIHAH